MSKKARKTIEVKELIDRVNKQIACPGTSKTARAVLGNLLEGILMDTGNYKGFNDLYWLQQGIQEWEAAGQPNNKVPFMGEDNRNYYYGGTVPAKDLPRKGD